MTATVSTSWRSRSRGEPHARSNSLNFLRLLLALLVAVSHSWPLAGFGETPRWGTFAVGDWAVSGFFAISGWLITSSRLSTGPVDFLWRRTLRIYPAFAACLLVVAFGFAPLAAALRGTAYRPADGVSYVLHNATLIIHQWGIGTTLAGAPRPDQWNGPLWSLAFEFICYLLIGALVTVVPRRLVSPAIVVSFLGLTVGQLIVAAGVVSVAAPLENLLRLAPFFFAGAVLYVFRDRVPWGLPAAGVAVIVLTISMALRLEVTLGTLALAFLLMWLGAVLPLTRVGRRNDISYGVYIYNGPVQQVLWILGAASLGVAGFAVLSILFTLPLAAASWFAVEKPAMRLRHLGKPIDGAVASLLDRLPRPGKRSGVGRANGDHADCSRTRTSRSSVDA